MDLDAVLSRHPQLALVDELAHTNAPGSRHPKRWQDVNELLDAGIDVFTTLNVQHLESRADTVRQITGAEIRETVSDSILDAAEIELVDLPPAELIDAPAAGQGLSARTRRQRRAEFFPRSQPHRAARAGVAARGRPRRRGHAGISPRAGRRGRVENRPPPAGGRQRQPAFRIAHPLDAPHGRQPEMPVAGGPRRKFPRAR